MIIIIRYSVGLYLHAFDLIILFLTCELKNRSVKKEKKKKHGKEMDNISTSITIYILIYMSRR